MSHDNEMSTTYMSDDLEAEFEADRKIEIEKFHNRVGKDTDDNKRTQNVVLIGTSGVGKSSFANTVMASFSEDCWRGRAYVGYHGTAASEQITHYLQSFKKDEYLEKRSKKSYNYPVLVDIGGFENLNDDLTKELLRIIFFGRLPEEEKLMDAVDHCKDHGLEGLRSKYKENFTNVKADRVVFVASAKEDSPLPTNFIEAVVTVAKRENREIPIFGVLTHKDMIDVQSQDFRQKEREFKEGLGIPEERYLLCTNYCEEYDRRVGRKKTDQCHPELDIPVIQFMRQVCDNAYKVIRRDLEYDESPKKNPNTRQTPPVEPTPEPTSDTSPESPGQTTTTNNSTDLPTIGHILLFAIKGLLIAVLLIWLLKPPIDGSELSVACSKYEHFKAAGKMEITELTNICGRQKEITQREIMLPLTCFVTVMVAVDFILPPILRKFPSL